MRRSFRTSQLKVTSKPFFIYYGCISKKQNRKKVHFPQGTSRARARSISADAGGGDPSHCQGSRKSKEWKGLRMESEWGGVFRPPPLT